MKQPIPFGKYFLLERINVGGMAEVYKAKATGVEGFERMVAVKRILPSIAEDEEFITMFIDEAKIAVQLTHANIAQIFDLGKVGENYFIALEYVNGKDLRAIFHRARHRGEQIPIPMACYITMKICEGLDYAHNKRDGANEFLNLVHRDVSPQNILVSYEGEVKLIDFGIAKAAGKAGRTQAGILKGKFGYMSPEQVQQGIEIDRCSDIFGVGICLYELLTGERLFVAETDFATLEKVRKVEIMPPSTYNRRIPEELEQIVLRALARDRGHRPQTAMALHDELQSFMYTSGNFFGRKDLSLYMHRVFGEEITKERTRDAEYARLQLPGSAPEPATDESDLGGFADLDPVSAVSELSSIEEISSIPAYQQPAPAYQQPAPMHSSGPAMPPAGGMPRKATLLGMPAVARPVVARQPSVPPLRPHAHSIPPSHAPASGVRPATLPGTAPAPIPMNGPRPAASPGGWDDEDLETQIYDKDDGPPIPDFVPAKGPLPRRPSAVSAEAFPQDEAAAMRRGAAVPAFVAWLALLMALGGAGYWWFTRAPEVGALQLAAEPKDAQLVIDGNIVATGSPFVVGDLTPKVAHAIEVRKEGYHPWQIKLQLQPGQRMELPAVSLEPVESGFALDSVPSGATVVIDGKALDDTTPIRLTELEPGDHQVRLESPGYAAWESALHVVVGKVLDLPKAELTPLVGEGAAQAEPEEEAAPPEPAQPRRTAPAPRVERRTAPAPRPRPAPIAAAPAAPSGGGGEGTLRVQTRPWSKVFVDGRLIGNTPQMAIRLSAGSHSVTFVNDEFGIRKTVTIKIGAGETVTKILTLTE